MQRGRGWEGMKLQVITVLPPAVPRGERHAHPRQNAASRNGTLLVRGGMLNACSNVLCGARAAARAQSARIEKVAHMREQRC